MCAILLLLISRSVHVDSARLRACVRASVTVAIRADVFGQMCNNYNTTWQQILNVTHLHINHCLATRCRHLHPHHRHHRDEHLCLCVCVCVRVCVCVFYISFVHGVLAQSKTYTFVYEFCLA